MLLYIVQHGDAVPEQIDPDRPLSDKGRADIRRLAEWLSSHHVSVAQILHSGKTRARETAEILRPLLKSGGAIHEQQGLAPNDSAGDFLRQMRSEEKDTLIAGHMPFVARAVTLALSATADSQLVAFCPGSVAGMQRGPGDAWQLLMFVRPENL